jgi:hypothetical protein
MRNLNRVILEGANHKDPKPQKTVTIYFDAEKKHTQVINPTEHFDERYLHDLVRSAAGGSYHSFQIK